LHVAPVERDDTGHGERHRRPRPRWWHPAGGQAGGERGGDRVEQFAGGGPGRQSQLGRHV